MEESLNYLKASIKANQQNTDARYDYELVKKLLKEQQQQGKPLLSPETKAYHERRDQHFVSQFERTSWLGVDACMFLCIMIILCDGMEQCSKLTIAEPSIRSRFYWNSHCRQVFFPW